MEIEKTKEILRMAKKAGLIDKSSSFLKKSLSESGFKTNAPGSVNYVLSRLFWMLNEDCFKVNKEET